MIAFGPVKYLSFGEHVLDAFCVGAGIIFFTYESVTNSQGGTLYNIALALRTLRVLKFLWLSETLHGLLWTIIKLGDSLVKLFFILFVPLYMFATVAQQIFGTTVVTSFTNESPKVIDAIKKTKWYAVRSELNFETGMNSMRTLFEITTVSSWNMVMEAADILYGNKQYTFWVELFFFSFRIIMTMMFVPVLTGFLIESFVVNFDIYEKNKAGIELISTAKQDAFELRKLQAGDSYNKRRSRASTLQSIKTSVSHPQVQHVKSLLKNRKNIDEVEKKIYGFDDIVQKELIKTLRKSLKAQNEKTRVGMLVGKETDKQTRNLVNELRALHEKHKSLSETHTNLQATHQKLSETHKSVLQIMESIGHKHTQNNEAVIIQNSKWELVKKTFLSSPEKEKDMKLIQQLHEKGNVDVLDRKKEIISHNELEELVAKVEEANEPPPSPPPSPPNNPLNM